MSMCLQHCVGTGWGRHDSRVQTERRNVVHLQSTKNDKCKEVLKVWCSLRSLRYQALAQVYGSVKAHTWHDKKHASDHRPGGKDLFPTACHIAEIAFILILADVCVRQLRDGELRRLKGGDCTLRCYRELAQPAGDATYRISSSQGRGASFLAEGLFRAVRTGSGHLPRFLVLLREGEAPCEGEEQGLEGDAGGLHGRGRRGVTHGFDIFGTPGAEQKRESEYLYWSTL
eukprot:scaffold1411_cov252-Pinguiococcus_pyrenoidosus.AAC.11